MCKIRTQPRKLTPPAGTVRFRLHVYSFRLCLTHTLTVHSRYPSWIAHVAVNPAIKNRCPIPVYLSASAARLASNAIR